MYICQVVILKWLILSWDLIFKSFFFFFFKAHSVIFSISKHNRSLIWLLKILNKTSMQVTLIKPPAALAWATPACSTSLPPSSPKDLE